MSQQLPTKPVYFLPDTWEPLTDTLHEIGRRPSAIRINRR